MEPSRHHPDSSLYYSLHIIYMGFFIPVVYALLKIIVYVIAVIQVAPRDYYEKMFQTCCLHDVLPTFIKQIKYNILDVQ